MSSAPELASPLGRPAAAAPPTPAAPPAARPATTLGPSPTPAPARRRAQGLGKDLLPRATWALSRTGRPGLAGIALLLAAALFLVSTHLKVSGEVKTLRADLEAARQARTAVVQKVDTAADPVAALRALPARSEVPNMLRQLFREATKADLAVDTAKYEITATKGAGVVRHQIAFPVTGPYPALRTFIDSTLANMPWVALKELSFDRKSIGDGDVEAQIRITIYTRSAP